MNTKRPAWWPTEESKRHADAGCAHPGLCKVDRLSVDRLASEDADACPVDGIPCRECPTYCLESE